MSVAFGGRRQGLSLTLLSRSCTLSENTIDKQLYTLVILGLLLAYKALRAGAYAWKGTPKRGWTATETQCRRVRFRLCSLLIHKIQACHSIVNATRYSADTYICGREEKLPATFAMRRKATGAGDLPVANSPSGMSSVPTHPGAKRKDQRQRARFRTVFALLVLLLLVYYSFVYYHWLQLQGVHLAAQPVNHCFLSISVLRARSSFPRSAQTDDACALPSSAAMGDPLKPIKLPRLSDLEQFQGDFANELLWVRLAAPLLPSQRLQNRQSHELHP